MSNSRDCPSQLQRRTEDVAQHGRVHCRPVQSSDRSARRIELAVDYMLRHLHQPLQVSTLSAIAGISTSYFFAVFKSAFGCAPMSFFVRQRMKRACELLMNQALSVKEIALDLGYEDPFHFSRVFKSVTGMAPTLYRHKIICPTRSPVAYDGRILRDGNNTNFGTRASQHGTEPQPR